MVVSSRLFLRQALVQKLPIFKRRAMSTARSKILIRDARLEDMGAVADIYNHFVVLPGNVATFDEEALPVSKLEWRYNDVKGSNLPYIVACLDEGEGKDGTVVGYAYARTYGERKSYQYSVEESIYISPDHLRMGIGKKLMMDLLRRLKEQGLKQVVGILGTEEDNPGSYKLHVDCGFKRCALFKKIGFKHNRWIDRLHMQVSLDEDGVGGIDDHVF